jgi:hypothetical protein
MWGFKGWLIVWRITEDLLNSYSEIYRSRKALELVVVVGGGDEGL